jgi:N-acetylneuraminate lyase
MAQPGAAERRLLLRAALPGPTLLATFVCTREVALDMKKPTLKGLVAAVHTPFQADGALNLAVVEQQAQHLARHRISTVFICGSTGESHSLTLDERRRLAQRWMEVTRGTQMQVVIHVGSNCLLDACELAAQAEALEALAVAALAPCYFKPRTLVDLVEWCARIAAAAPATPFYFYDIPVLTGVNFSMKSFLGAAASRIPTLAGIKFTNTDLMAYQLCLAEGGGAFDIPWGVDESLVSALAVGAKGAVGSSYNFASPIYQRLLAAFERGDLAAAGQEQMRSVQLIEALAALGYMGAAKLVMKMLGVDVGPARLPNGNPTPEQAEKLRAGLEKLGFFEWIAAKPASAGAAK